MQTCLTIKKYRSIPAIKILLTRIINQLKWCQLLLVSLILTGCTIAPALRPVKDPSATWQYYQQQLQPLQHWHITGLIGVNTPQKAFSANINWSQQHSIYHIELSGPLGIGAVSITNVSGEVVLTDAHGKQYTATTPEVLMDQQLGWSVPVNGLSYWIRGLPTPGFAFQSHLNQYGTLATLSQSSWQIQYQHYRRMSGYPIPGRLIMTNHALRVVIVVNNMVP